VRHIRAAEKRRHSNNAAHNLPITVSTQSVHRQLSHNAFNLLVKFFFISLVDPVANYPSLQTRLLEFGDRFRVW